MLTNSTLGNWCNLIIPFVSRPAAPASFRKQCEKAVYLRGSSSSSTIFFLTKFVSGTSAVGISHKSLSVLY